MANDTTATMSLEEAVQRAHQLHREGYEKQGNWNLAQTCHHLSLWMTYPIDGFPPAPWFLRPVFWVFRTFFGKRMLRGILTNGFRAGTPTNPETVPAADAINESEALDSLARAVDRIQHHEGAFYRSPLFGDMDRETVLQLQRLHCQHHLGMLSAKA